MYGLRVSYVAIIDREKLDGYPGMKSASVCSTSVWVTQRRTGGRDPSSGCGLTSVWEMWTAGHSLGPSSWPIGCSDTHLLTNTKSWARSANPWDVITCKSCGKSIRWILPSTGMCTTTSELAPYMR